MKALISFMLIISSYFSSQTLSFNSDHGNVTWQKIFDSNDSFSELLNKIKISGNFYDIDSDENRGQIFFKFKDLKAKYKQMGYSSTSMSAYVSTGLFFGAGLIEIKDRKYRATFSNIKYEYSYLSIATLEETKSINAIEDVAIKKGTDEFKNSFIKRDAGILDFTFDYIVDMTKMNVNKNGDNW